MRERTKENLVTETLAAAAVALTTRGARSFSGRPQQFVIGIAIVGAIIAGSVERDVQMRGLGR